MFKILNVLFNDCTDPVFSPWIDLRNCKSNGHLVKRHLSYLDTNVHFSSKLQTWHFQHLYLIFNCTVFLCSLLVHLSEVSSFSPAVFGIFPFGKEDWRTGDAPGRLTNSAHWENIIMIILCWFSNGSPEILKQIMKSLNIKQKK